MASEPNTGEWPPSEIKRLRARVAELERDASALAASFNRNRPALLAALQSAGAPSSWLTGWARKLERMTAATEGSATDGDS